MAIVEPAPNVHWRVYLEVAIDMVGPPNTAAAVAFAAESVHHEAITLHDADCKVVQVVDDKETGPFYRTTDYRAALETLDEEGESWRTR